MRTLNLLAIVAALLLTGAAAHAGLFAYGQLDSAANDPISGFNATPATGNVTYGTVDGREAATFVANDSLNISYDAALNPTSFTLTTWAQVAAGTSHRSVITSRDDITGDNSTGFIIYAMPDNTWSFWSGDGAGGGNWHELDGTTATVGNWDHLAVSYDAGTQTKSFYVNGVHAGTSPVTGTTTYAPNTVNGFHIGGGGDTGTSFRFNGSIDDMALYNTALSQTEIQSIMTNSVTIARTIKASFDIGNGALYTGAGPATTATTTWTRIDDTTGNKNTVNGITVEVFAGSGYSDPPNTADPGDPDDLVGDFTLQNGGDGQGGWKITGLDPDSEYEIYMIAPDGTGWGDTNVYGADYTALVGSANLATVTATGGTAAPFTDFVEGVDYAVFTGVQSDATGEFSGTYNRIDGQPHTGLAGVQVVLVPEPATMSLLALGGIAMLRRRKK